jgi:hypothetical protein
MVAKKLIANLQLTRNPRSGGMTCPRGEWTTFEWAPLPKSRLFWSMWRSQGSMLGSSIMQARKMSCNTAYDPWISGVDPQAPLFKRDHVNPASPLGVVFEGCQILMADSLRVFQGLFIWGWQDCRVHAVEVANFPMPWQPGRYKPAVCSSREANAFLHVILYGHLGVDRIWDVQTILIKTEICSKIPYSIYFGMTITIIITVLKNK